MSAISFREQSARLLLISVIVAMISASCTSVNTETTLKDAYADSFMIGCAVNPLHTGGHLEQATDLILEHFNAISPETA